MCMRKAHCRDAANQKFIKLGLLLHRRFACATADLPPVGRSSAEQCRAVLLYSNSFKFVMFQRIDWTD